MTLRREITQDHVGHAGKALRDGLLRQQRAAEHGFKRVAIGHISETEGGDRDVEIKRINPVAENAFVSATAQDARDLLQDRSVQRRHVAGGLQVGGAKQVFGVDQPHEGRIVDVIAEREGDQCSNGLRRLRRVEVEAVLGGANVGVDRLQRGKVQLLLAAEIMVEQRLVGVGTLGDAVHPRSAKAGGRKLGNRRCQQRTTALLRRTLAMTQSAARFPLRISVHAAPLFTPSQAFCR